MAEFGIRALDPEGLPEPSGTYTHGTAVAGVGRMVFVSGQVAWADGEGRTPKDFATQCRQVWGNVLAVLHEGGMDVGNLAKVTVYLAHRRYRDEAERISAEVLGPHRPAFTSIITTIYREQWLLEIEGVATAP